MRFTAATDDGSQIYYRCGGYTTSTAYKRPLHTDQPHSIGFSPAIARLAVPTYRCQRLSPSPKRCLPHHRWKVRALRTAQTPKIQSWVYPHWSCLPTAVIGSVMILPMRFGAGKYLQRVNPSTAENHRHRLRRSMTRNDERAGATVRTPRHPDRPIKSVRIVSKPSQRQRHLLTATIPPRIKPTVKRQTIANSLAAA